MTPKQATKGWQDFQRVIAEAKAAIENDIENAAIKWCGEKERETFPEDIEYFKHNWRALPGLRRYVDAEIAARATPLPTE